MATQTPREKLMAMMRGTTFTIPDLEEILKDFPRGTHPELNRLREYANAKLEKLFPEGERLRKMKEADFGLFTAKFWPYDVSFERMCVAADLSIWLFVWDDEIDSTEYTSLVQDFDRATEYRNETKRFVRGCLAGDNEQCTASHPLITFFKSIGEAISRDCTPAQIEMFQKEVFFWIDMCEVEQQIQLSGKFPSIEEFQKYKIGSSATNVVYTTIEYCWEMEIPPQIMRSQDMRTIWDAANEIVSISNDIVSIQKELPNNQIDTLIPLMCQHLHLGSVQAAVDRAADMIREKVAVFDETARRLLAQNSHDPTLHGKLEKFLDGCRYTCTGNLDWSCLTGRYGLKGQSTRDGIRVTL